MFYAVIIAYYTLNIVKDQSYHSSAQQTLTRIQFHSKLDQSSSRGIMTSMKRLPMYCLLRS